MKGNKNTFSNKYIKIMLLALLIISSILSMYLVTNTNNKVFNAKIINQKAINQGIPREVVNIPDQDLKNFLLTYFKKPDNERITNTLILSDNYIKPSDENEIYKDEMEKITKISADNINTKETAMDLTGLEKAINLTYLSLTKNKIENIEPLKGLTNLTELYLAKNKIENVEPLKGLINLITLSLTNNKVENIEPLKGLTQLTFLNLGTNKIENIEPLMGLTSLRNLTLVGNKIENIEPLMGLTNLTDLGLSYNKIENIEPLKGLTNLKSLYLLDNKIENIEPLKGLTQLTFLNLANNKIENIEPLKGLTKLINLYLSYNKIENIEPLKELTNVTTLALYNEEINVSPSTYKFNLPVLKKYNGEILDIVQASNGLLRKNSDGTYSFTRKVTGIQTVNVGIGIGYNDPKVDANWNSNNPIYILKIDPTNIPEEKISITKTIKDKSNTLLNNDKETKVVPVIKQNEQVINNSNTNNVGHRANNDELLTYTWNELPKYDDNYVPYNYEVTFDISGLPEGYSIEPNTKTADNQADFNITYVSLKVTVNKEITVNGGDKSRLPNEITVTISNDKGLPEKEVTATLKADKSGYVVNENLDKTDANGDVVTYKVTPKTDISNYRKTENSYEYEVQNTEVRKTLPVNGGNKESLPKTLKVNIINKDNGNVIKEVTATLKPDKSGYEVVENMPVTNFDGRVINYDIKLKEDITNYERINNNSEYRYVSPKVTFKGKVKWQGGETLAKPNVKIGLMRNGVRVEGLDKTVVTEKNTNEVEVQFTNVDEKDFDGNDYTYTIVEDTELQNFVKQYTENNTVVVNTYVSPKINFEKTVKQNGGKNIPVKVTLTRNGVNVTPEKTVTVNTGETARFTDLDKTDLNGNPYKYDGVITATLPEGYSWKKDKDGNIVVEYRSPKINLTVEKMWDGGDTLIPENIEVKLKRRLKQVNGNNTNTYVDFENNTYQVEKNNNWTKEISNLDKTDENANEYEYIVEEITNIENFTNKVNNFRITNIYNVPNIDLPINVNITGGNKDKLPSSIEVQIIDKKTGNVSRTVIVPLNGDKTGYSKIENIEKTDKQGNVINYKVKVLTDIPNYVKPENTENTTETLTYKSPKITFEKDIHINPELIKNMKKDGIKDIQVNVMRNGEVIKTITVPLTNFDENGNYKVVVPDLDETDQNGNKYNYDIDVINIPTYDVEKQNGVLTITKKVERFTKEGTVVFNGGKVRPTVIVEVLKDGKVLREEKVTNGKYRFNDLEKNDKLGNVFKYSLRVKNEKEIKEKYNYDVVVNDLGNAEKGNISLNYVSPKIDVPFKLVYQGANGDKPKVNIRLVRDGKEIGDIVKLNGEYEYVFKGVDKTDQNGNDYEYRVKVVGEVEGYEVTISPSGKTVILTKKLEKGKILPYAGAEKNIGFGVILVAMIGYSLRVLKEQRRINNIRKIRGIKR